MFYKNLLIVAFLALAFFVSDSKAQVNQNQNIPTLTYSELIQNKESYLGKMVRVKAVWTYGFEWTYFCDLECKNRDDKAWIDLVDEDELCKGSKGKLKKMGKKFDNRAEVIVVGKLIGGERYGHENGYNYQFVINCVEKCKKLPARTG